MLSVPTWCGKPDEGLRGLVKVCTGCREGDRQRRFGGLGTWQGRSIKGNLPGADTMETRAYHCQSESLCEIQYGSEIQSGLAYGLPLQEAAEQCVTSHLIELYIHLKFLWARWQGWRNIRSSVELVEEWTCCLNRLAYIPIILCFLRYNYCLLGTHQLKDGFQSHPFNIDYVIASLKNPGSVSWGARRIVPWPNPNLQRGGNGAVS